MTWKSLIVGAIVMTLEPIAQCGLAWRVIIIIGLIIASFFASLFGEIGRQLRHG